MTVEYEVREEEGVRGGRGRVVVVVFRRVSVLLIYRGLAVIFIYSQNVAVGFIPICSWGLASAPKIAPFAYFLSINSNLGHMKMSREAEEHVSMPVAA